MKSHSQFAIGSYLLLLNLYPEAYREEYGEELQAVFNLALDDAEKKGMGSLASGSARIVQFADSNPS